MCIRDSYIVVDGLLPSYQGDYKLEVSCGYLFCGDSQALTCGRPFNYNNNYGQDNVSLYSCGNHINVENNGPEVVHHFTTTSTGTVDISLTNLSCNLEMFLLSSCDRGACVDFSSNPGASDEHISTYLQPGTYYVVVDGYNGAACNYNLTVNCPSSCNIDVDVSTTGSNCGQSNGSFTVTSSGGTPGYIVTWQGPINGSFSTYANVCTISNVPPGIYTVTKTDVNGCSDYEVVEVKDYGSQLGLNLNVTNAVCNMKGSVRVQVSNGSGPYSIHLSGPTNGTATTINNSFNINDLPAGDYTLYIVDKNGCSVSKDFTVQQENNNFSISGWVDHAKCETKGAIHISVDNGCATYTVLVDGPVSGSATTNSANFFIPNLPGGTYTVTVEDCNWCSDVKTFIIEDEEIDIDLVTNNGICGQDGSITVNISNGNPNYTINWSGPTSGSATSSNPSYTIPGLASGTYSVTVMDGNWCSDYQVATIDNSGNNLDVDINVVDGACGKASIWVDINTGQGPFTISWDGPVMGSGTTVNNGYDIPDLPNGTYWINVQDDNGCTYMDEIVIDEPASDLTVEAWPNNGTCGNLGSVELTISNGTAPYSISWTGAAINSTTSNSSVVIIEDLASGTYNFEIVDKFGCGAWVTVVIENGGSDLDASATVWPGECGAGGEITISIQNGCPDYHIAWEGPISGSATSSSSIYAINNAPTGTYSITVTDCNGCKKIFSSNINNNGNDLNISLNGTNVTCSAKGSVHIGITGGNSPYSINWSGAANGSDNTNGNNYDIIDLGAGTYDVTVTGANGCSDNGSITIVNEPGDISVTANVTNGVCGSTGSVDLTFPSGTYTITWDGPASGTSNVTGTTFTITDLVAGWYNVTVEDDKGCKGEVGFEIMAMPSDVSVDITIVDSDCCAGGEAIATASGGDGNYTYTWNPNVSTDNGIWNVPPGVYSLTVTDGNGCTAEDVAVIGNNCDCPDIFSSDTLFFPAGPDISVCVPIPFLESSTYEVILNGSEYVLPRTACDVDSLVSYAYFVLFGQGQAGPYQVDSWTVGGNTFSGMVQDMDALADSMNVWDPTGAWFHDPAFISITGGNASAGYGPMVVTHIASGVQSTMQTNFTGVAFGFGVDVEDDPGYQTLIINDTVSCCTDTVVICIENLCDLEIDLSHTDANCEQCGNIWVDMSGGLPPYNVSWSGPESGSGSITGSNFEILCVPAGSYTITVVDANKCTVMEDVYIDDLGTDLDITTTASDASCGANGSIWIDINSGPDSYLITWDGPVSGTSSTTSNNFEITDLPLGVYTITVKNANGCKGTSLVSIDDQGSNIVINSTPSNANCNSPGSVYLNTSGATTPITIDVSGPGGNSSTSSTTGNATINDLPAGNYTVVITDANGCEGTGSFVIEDSGSNIQLNANAPAVACGTSSYIDLSIAGGIAPYDVNWSGPLSGNANTSDSKFTIGNLSTGLYHIVVIDKNGCSSSIDVEVLDNGGDLSATISGVNGLCGANGSFEVNISSGAAPFVIAWNGPSTGSSTISDNSFSVGDLPTGTYSIQVEDANGCTYHKNIDISNDANGISIGVTSINGECGSSGSIEIAVAGGTAPFDVVVSGTMNINQSINASTTTINDLNSGSYTITITDANGCVDTEMITIDNSANNLNLSATAINGNCGQNPSISLNISGGTPSYDVSWSGPENGTTTTMDPTMSINDLADGTYTITVSDANGCSQSQTLTIRSNPDLILNVTAADAACNVPGKLFINVAGGIPDYIIDWSGPNASGGVFTTSSPSNELNNLEPGTYVVAVTDDSGCSAVQTITVNGGSGNLEASIMGSNAYCNIGGGIWINIFDGVAPFELAWTGQESGSYTTELNIYDIANLSPGAYEVMLTDASGCSISKTILIEENGIQGWDFEAIASNASCEASGSVYLNFTQGSPDYSINWAGPVSGMQTISNNEYTITGLETGTYSITATEGNGCQSSVKVVEILGESSSMGFSANVINSDCGSGGSIILDMSGSTTGYLVVWNGPSSGSQLVETDQQFTITNLGTGAYTVSIEDGSGCASSQSIVVGGSDALDVSHSSNNASCDNDEGIINLNFVNFNGNYTVTWTGPVSNSATSNNAQYSITGLPGGDYEVNVVDEGGCTYNFNQNIDNSSDSVSSGFTYTTTNVGASFVNTSSSGTYFWDFGDGKTSTEINPIHEFCDQGTYTVCLTVTNSCGTSTTCQEVSVIIPESIVILDVMDGNGAAGNTICVPVTVSHTQLIVSLAGSIRIGNEEVCEIVGLTPGAITPTFFENNNTFNYFENNGQGIEVKDGTELFCIELRLTGDAGNTSTIEIVDEPLPVEIGTMENGVPVALDHTCLKGIVSIDASARLSGTVMTYWGEGIKDTEMHILSDSYTEMQMTDENGYYMEPNVPIGELYMVEPARDFNDENGLSTYALFVGQRFILGMDPIEIISPYQVIAGDANCSGSFTTLDLFILQQLIIGTNDNLDFCPSWVFVNDNNDMPADFNSYNVFPYNNFDELMVMDDTISNFVGVKVGDILGHADPARSTGNMPFRIEDKTVEEGEEFEIQFTSEAFDEIVSYQLGLRFDEQAMELVELIKPDHDELASTAVGTNFSDSGELRASWFSLDGEALSVDDNETLFTMKFKALREIESVYELFKIDNRSIVSEAHNINFQRLDITLELYDETVTSTDPVSVAYPFELAQNTPNPFHDFTIIAFTLPARMDVELLIHNNIGEVVKEVKGTFKKGQNELRILKEEIGTGVFYYTLKTDDFSKTRSMISTD